MADTQLALTKYFQGTEPFNGLGLEEVRSSYKWKLPKTSFNGEQVVTSGTNFEENVRLKLFLNKIWNEEEWSRRKIVGWIISDWGGIRSNKQSTLEKYYKESLQENPKTPLTGIASFSKVLAIKDPLKYAIYDARVAVGLNAIQMILAVTSGEIFPYLSGRNKITGDWSAKPPRGFSKSKEASITTLTYPPYNWKKIPISDAYERYLELLQLISKNLDVPLYELEMTLFSQAEELAIRAVPSLGAKIN